MDFGFAEAATHEGVLEQMGKRVEFLEGDNGGGVEVRGQCWRLHGFWFEKLGTKDKSLTAIEV